MSQLSGNTTISATMTGGIWPVQAPLGTLPPFAVVSPAAGADRQGIAGYRLMYEGPFQITFWGAASASDTLQSCANAADATLQPGGHASQGTSPDGKAQIISCLREHPLPIRPDWVDQSLRIGIGALWRLQIRSLP